MTDKYHYDKDGNYAGKTTDTPPASLLGLILVAVVMLAFCSDGKSKSTANESISTIATANANSNNRVEPMLNEAPAKDQSPSIMPSFDCSHAATLVERLICSNSQLASADIEMVQLYKEKLGSNNAAQVKASQREWRNSDRNSCENIQCLLSAYRSRIQSLKSM